MAIGKMKAEGLNAGHIMKVILAEQFYTITLGQTPVGFQ